MRTVLCFVAIAAWLTVAQNRLRAQDKPKLLAINGFMFKGVFTELDAEQMKAQAVAGRYRKAPFRRQVDGD